MEGKGRGIFAATGFNKAEFIVEYHGDLLELSEAKEREAKYALDPQKGCYMYYFQYHTKTYWWVQINTWNIIDTWLYTYLIYYLFILSS